MLTGQVKAVSEFSGVLNIGKLPGTFSRLMCVVIDNAVWWSYTARVMGSLPILGLRCWCSSFHLSCWIKEGRKFSGCYCTVSFHVAKLVCTELRFAFICIYIVFYTHRLRCSFLFLLLKLKTDWCLVAIRIYSCLSYWLFLQVWFCSLHLGILLLYESTSWVM